MAEPSDLVPGTDYSWEELGAMFGFAPNYLGAAGGMVSRPDHNALLLMTHPGGARSIDYGDYWDEETGDLIYTGRGKTGDQQRTGQNRDLGDNTKDVYVFQPAGPRQLHFLGQPTTTEEWTARDEDAEGNDRTVLRFRLHFQTPPPSRSSRDQDRSPRQEAARNPRPFDPGHAPRESMIGESSRTPEETHALREKAVQGHHELLSALAAWLGDQGWTEIEEIPSAVDLWARRPADNVRVIFEAKTVRVGSEGARIRSAIAQLLEYRFFYGELGDQLCVVCNRPISDRRVRLLDGLGIAVLWQDGEEFAAGSATAGGLVREPLTSPSGVSRPLGRSSRAAAR